MDDVILQAKLNKFLFVLFIINKKYTRMSIKKYYKFLLTSTWYQNVLYVVQLHPFYMHH